MPKQSGYNVSCNCSGIKFVSRRPQKTEMIKGVVIGEECPKCGQAKIYSRAQR